MGMLDVNRRARGELAAKLAAAQLATARLDDGLSGRLEHDFTWEQAVRVLRKHARWSSLLCAALITLVVLAAVLPKDVYQPVARLEMAPMNNGFRALQEGDESQIADQDYLETQSQILRSDALAMSVIRTLHLDSNPEFVSKEEQAALKQNQENLKQTPTSRVEDTSFLQEQFALVERTPPEAAALEGFQKRLGVNRIRNSRLVEVSFSSHDPGLSQTVTNTLITQYMDQNYRHRYASTMRASEWLSAQLSDLRQKVEEANQAVSDYQRRYGLVEMDDRDVPLAQLMSEVNHQLSDAQANRIETEAYVRMIDLGQSAVIPAVRDDKVYQELLTRYADLRGQLAQVRTIYGDENANVKKLENEANEIGAQAEGERMRMVDRVRTAFAAARDREKMMLAAREKLRAQMGDASSHMVTFRVLRNEATAKAQLYNTLQGRLKEAGIFAGLRSSNINVVDLAPRLRRPTGPPRKMIIAAGSMLSLLLGLALAFVRESFSNTLRTPDDIKQWTGMPSLGMLPRINGTQHAGIGHLLRWKLGAGPVANGAERLPRVLPARSHAAEAEAMRYLRAELLLRAASAPARVILVSSASSSEGKTTTALNLAEALGQRGNTCLVESDLRRPMFAEALGLNSKIGLSEVLSGTASLEQALVHVRCDLGCAVLACGSAIANPDSLIESQHMRALLIALRDKFEYVVIDSPPVIPYSDARVLSTLADAVVLVGRYGFTTRRALSRCAQLLEEAGAPVLGVVLNDIGLESPDYHYYNYGFSSRMTKVDPYMPHTPRQQEAALATQAEKPTKAKSAHA